MLRVFFVGFVLSSFVGEGSFIKANDLDRDVEYSSVESTVDPIITGKSISVEHKRMWNIQNKEYLECGLCGEEPQAFPSD